MVGLNIDFFFFAVSTSSHHLKMGSVWWMNVNFLHAFLCSFEIWPHFLFCTLTASSFAYFEWIAWNIKSPSDTFYSAWSEDDLSRGFWDLTKTAGCEKGFFFFQDIKIFLYGFEHFHLTLEGCKENKNQTLEKQQRKKTHFSLLWQYSVRGC